MDTIPSFAPRTAARSQPTRSLRCRSRCFMGTPCHSPVMRSEAGAHTRRRNDRSRTGRRSMGASVHSVREVRPWACERCPTRSGVLALAQHDQQHARRLGGLERVRHPPGHAHQGARRGANGLAPDRQGERPREHQNERVERRRVLLERLAGVEREQRDVPPVVLASTRLAIPCSVGVTRSDRGSTCAGGTLFLSAVMTIPPRKSGTAARFWSEWSTTSSATCSRATIPSPRLRSQ